MLFLEFLQFLHFHRWEMEGGISELRAVNLERPGEMGHKMLQIIHNFLPIFCYTDYRKRLGGNAYAGLARCRSFLLAFL